MIDFDNDGDKEIIIGDNNGFIRIYNNNGSEIVDETFPYNTGIGKKIWGSASAAAINDDEYIDFVLGSSSKSLYIFDHTGKLLPILAVNELHSNMIFISKFNPLN